MLDRFYGNCLGVADWCVSHPRVLLLVIAPILTLIVAAIGQLVLQDFPNSGDEYAYLYQAATFAQGRLWNAASAAPEFFTLSYIIQGDGREYSSFPLGWPLLLALAMRLHFPAWMVNPVLGTVSLVFVALLGARLHNARVGMLAAGIVAVSGFFLFNAASYFSHVFCSTLLLAAAYAAVHDERPRAWAPVMVGFLLGWAVLARYFTAVVCGIPVALLLFRASGSWTARADSTASIARTIALVALGGLPWVVVLGAYNLAVNGSPWELTTLPSTVGLWFRPKFAMRGADILSTQMLRFVLWTPPLLLFTYIFYLATADKRVRRGLIDWMPVLMAAGLYCYTERGGNQYGPRFYYETFPFLAIFTAACVFKEPRLDQKSIGDRRAFALLAASVLAMPLSLAAHVFIEHRVIAERRDPYQIAAAAGLADALVLIGGRVGTTRSMGTLDFTRNGTSYDRSVLYGLDMGPEENCRAHDAYPDRALYLYSWDVVARRGVLTPVSCARSVR
jgi:hypothetical protein